VVSSFFSTLAPILVGGAVYWAGSWRWALAIMALAPLLMLLGFRKVSAPLISSPRLNPAQTRQSLPALYWIFWIAIVLAVSVEFCMIYWSADYLENGLGMLKVDAAQAVSLFLGAMIIGRWGGSRLVQRFAAPKIVIAAILVAAAGFALFWRAETIAMGLAGLFFCGLGVANLYPLTLAIAIGVSNGNSIAASARATLASGVAILLLPLILGRLADAFGIRQAYGVVAILLLGIFLIIFFAGRRAAAPAVSNE
jgi:fucose permease